MSFFDTEGFHAVVPASGADEGGRSAPQGNPGPPRREVCRGDGRPPGSSETSRLRAPAKFGAKKDIHSPHNGKVAELTQ